MPILAQIPATLKVTSDARPHVPVQLLVTDASAFHADVHIDDSAAQARMQRGSRLGFGLTIGRPDGVMLPVPDGDVGRALTIDEDASRFGDILTFQLAGTERSPFNRASLRMRLPVHVDLVTGSPAAQYRKRVFEGYISKHTYSDAPPQADVIAIDAAALYAERRAKDYTIPQNSGRTREEITMDLLAIGEIPFGGGDFGPGGGGVISRAYAVGDTSILQWLQAFLRVVGLEIGFVFGAVHVFRYDRDAVPTMELTTEDIVRGTQADPPEVLAQNVSGVVTVNVTQQSVDASGDRIVETLNETYAPYAPAVALQQLSGGVFVATGLTPVLAVQKIAEIRTRATMRGTLAIRTETTEKAMYAPRSARFEVRAVNPGAADDEEIEQRPHFSPLHGTYIFSDGSTRRELRERLMTVRRTIETKDVNAVGEVVEERKQVFEYRNTRAAIFDVNEVGGELFDHPRGAGFWIPVMDDGEGSVLGYETIGGIDFITESRWSTTPDTTEDVTSTLTTEGNLSSQVSSTSGFDAGAETIRQDGVHGYGIDQQKRRYFDAESEEFRVQRLQIRNYQRVSEDAHTITTSTRVGSGAPVTTVERGSESAPRAERIEPITSSQEIRSTVKDAERIAYVFGDEIGDDEHNEFVQNQVEADAYALQLARERSAMVLTMTLPIETQLHKFKYILVSIPESGIVRRRFWVRSLRRDCGTFSQSVVAWAFAPQFGG